MNPFEMVIGIILIVTIGSVLKARYGVRKDALGNEYVASDTETLAENKRLQDELRGLKERVQVLERVVTDNETGARIDREIEKLRDKNNV
jgi:hypothetical protein